MSENIRSAKVAETEKPVLSASQVYRKIRKGIPVENVSVLDRIQLKSIASIRHGRWGNMKTTDTLIDSPVMFRNCYLRELIAGECAYYKPIVIEGCTIENAAFDSCYVKSGAIIDSCQFMKNMFLFLWSGDNVSDKPVKITDCIFHGFVDMFDAHFDGPVTISGCHFIKGTNLLGNQKIGPRVSFATPPIIEGNEGKLDLDGEMWDWDKQPDVPMSTEVLKRNKKFFFGFKL